MSIEFADFTKTEQEIVNKIVKRAMRLFDEVGNTSVRPIDIHMDLSAVHAHTPLRLAEFLEADDFNFAHDIGGIYRHINRQTGELEGFFLPRFAKPQPPEEEENAIEQANRLLDAITSHSQNRA